MKVVRIAAKPPLPAPVPASEHLSALDQGPVLPVSRRDRARAALGRVGVVPVTPESPADVSPLTAEPGAPDGGY